MVEECSVLPAISGYRSSRRLTVKECEPQARNIIHNIPELLWTPSGDERSEWEEPVKMADDDEAVDSETNSWQRLCKTIRSEHSACIFPEIQKLVSSEITRKKKLERYDPFKGNMVAVSRMSLKKDVAHEDNVLTVIGFAAGDNASKLCVLFVDTRKDIKSHARGNSGIPVGPVIASCTLNLRYPIRHICIMHGNSRDRTPNAASDYPLLMGVRTHCSTVLVHVQIYHNDQQNESEQHAEPTAYHIVMETLHEHVPANYATLDFSPGLPIAMCLSPFNESEYAIMTENGYLSIFDVRNAEGDDHMSLVAAYHLTEETKSTWRSISFVNDSRKLLVASSERVHMVDLKLLQSYVLYKTPIDDRIYTMSVPWGRNEYMYWLSTARDILLLDIREPMIPLTSQPHYMGYSPPIYSQLVSGTTDDFLFLWSSLYDHVICAKYQRSHNALTNEELSSPILQSLFQVIQSIPIEEVHSYDQGEVNIIPTIGFHAVFSSSTNIDSDSEGSKDADTFIYFRLLQDGSIRTLVFSEQQGEWTKYQKLGWKMDNNTLPADVRHTKRLVSIKSTDDLAGGLLNEVVDSVRSNKKPASNIPSLRTQLEQHASSTIPLTFNELLNQEGLDASVCEQLDEIPMKEERIECTNRRVRQSVIPSIGAESELAKIARMIKSSRLTYIAEPDSTSETSLRYIQPANDTFKLTPTTKYMASEWQPGLPDDASISFNSQSTEHQTTTQFLPFHYTQHDIPPRKRLSFSTPDDQSQPPFKKHHIPSQPEVVSSDNIASPVRAVASQPIPGAFANRQPIKKKKKARAKGFK
ncbi:hypothetical protein K492DRAFT_208642 [Lichtheimia hyalospora FSU 10163]|nr:hypothetical protein K492DRAFT_208642 [Lichtheimia hyalospora FSU 10163]